MDARRQTAIHECGHVVATLIAPKLPQPRSVSIKFDGESLGRVRGGVALDAATLTPALLEAALAARLAGLAAEDRALGRGAAAVDLSTCGSRGDLHDAARLLVSHQVNGAAADRLIERAMARAQFIIEDTWDVIEQLATWLERVEEFGERDIAAARVLLAVYVTASDAAERRMLRAVAVEAQLYRAHDAVRRARVVPATPARRRA